MRRLIDGIQLPSKSEVVLFWLNQSRPVDYTFLLNLLIHMNVLFGLMVSQYHERLEYMVNNPYYF